MRLFSLLNAFLLTSLFVSVGLATTLCKCDCEEGYEVLNLNEFFKDKSDVLESEYCSLCTVEFCKERDIEICKGHSDLLMNASCFQRESTKEALAIYSFALVVLGLVGYIVVHSYTH